MKSLILILFFVSCSHVEFINTSNVPVNFVGQQGHEIEYEKKFDTNFYLWGTMPRKVIVDFKEITDELDLKSVASLKIKRVNKLSSYLWPLFTFGFVAPRYYVLSFKAPKESMF
tara:strand:- start:741 stop:1082 length:342 start_codon:yes stop_codon:yes gene_type:complete